MVIKQREGKLEGKIWSIDEDTVVVAHEDGEDRKKIDIDLRTMS